MIGRLYEWLLRLLGSGQRVSSPQDSPKSATLIGRRIRALGRGLTAEEAESATRLEQAERTVNDRINQLRSLKCDFAHIAARGDRLRRAIADFLEDGSGTYSKVLHQWPATTPARQRAVLFLEAELGRFIGAADELLELAMLVQRVQDGLTRLVALAEAQPIAWARLVQDPALADRAASLDTVEQAGELVEHVAFLVDHLASRADDLSRFEAQLTGMLSLDSDRAAALAGLPLESRVGELMSIAGRTAAEEVQHSLHSASTTAAAHTRHLGFGSTPRDATFELAPKPIRVSLQRWELLRRAGERISATDE